MLIKFNLLERFNWLVDLYVRILIIRHEKYWLNKSPEITIAKKSIPFIESLKKYLKSQIFINKSNEIVH